MTAGQVFRNGEEYHAVNFNWREPLTVKRISEGYGVTRYLVADRYGRHGWAYR